MTKNDLKNGMFVELSDKTKWFVFRNDTIDVLVSPHDTMRGLVTLNFDIITEDLKVEFKDGSIGINKVLRDQTFTIDKIYGCPEVISSCADVYVRQVLRCVTASVLDSNVGKMRLIWERVAPTIYEHGDNCKSIGTACKECLVDFNNYLNKK